MLDDLSNPIRAARLQNRPNFETPKPARHLESVIEERESLDRIGLCHGGVLAEQRKGAARDLIITDQYTPRIGWCEEPFVRVKGERISASKRVGHPRIVLGHDGRCAVTPVDVEPHTVFLANLRHVVQGIDRPRVGGARRRAHRRGDETGRPVFLESGSQRVRLKAALVIDVQQSQIV